MAITISKKGLKENDPLEWLKLSFAINPSKLEEEFAKVGILVQTEEDLPVLAKIVESKADTQGLLRSEDGTDRPLVFDTMRIIQSGIKYSPEEKDSIKSLTFID